MRISFIKLFVILFLLSSVQIFPQQKFEIDLNDRTDDTFKITLTPSGITDDNNVFQFAATAPGTYQIMNIGRYVRDFTAYDKDGGTIPTKQISTNQWSLDTPSKITRIKYTIAETWDTPVDENPIWLMAGTSLEDEYVLINGQAVFGYFKGKQDSPVHVKLSYPDNWEIGTSLKKNSGGWFTAGSYDEIVDSPILLGTLTVASTMVDNTDIGIYTFSKQGLIKSDDILNSLSDMLEATNKFVKGLPVDRYVFLFYFGDKAMGAWEHSYSSTYVLAEQKFSPELKKSILSTAAHEFFHIMTPLNIHSELISNFNFEKPVLSRHLWLYEAATEWASHMILLRGGLITLQDHFDELKQKLTINDYFDQSINLIDLALHADSLTIQYGNIYHKGAVTIELLDILLLDLSDGKRGMREVLLELSEKYGPERSFSEESFVEEFIQMTYPEVGSFFAEYIQGTGKLPVKEYFQKLGINYYAEKGIDSASVTSGLEFGLDGERIILLNNSGINKEFKKGDILFKIEGEKVELAKIQQQFQQFQTAKIGDEVSFTMLRDGKEVELTAIMQAPLVKHVFEIDESLSPEQLKLREAWLKNL